MKLKENFFSLPRKKERIKAGAYDNSGKILVKSVNFLNKQDCSCISIYSEDKLYLTDNYIVTHNTFTAIAIATKLKQKTLVIVHTKFLLEQWVDEIQKTLGITPGVIGGGKDEISSIITIATMQSLRKRILELTSTFGTIIVDECHHQPAPVFKTIVDKFKARYKVGLSATLWRRDGRHQMLYDYFGVRAFTRWFHRKHSTQTNGIMLPRPMMVPG